MSRPLTLRVKTPSAPSAPNPAFPLHRHFLDTAKECAADGTFDKYFRLLLERLAHCERTRDKKETTYYTHAFRAFLAVQGGSYAIRPTPAAPMRIFIPVEPPPPPPPAAALPLPAAAFEPPE